MTYSDYDVELLELLEKAFNETTGCLSEDDALRLYDCGLRGEGSIVVSVDGIRLTMPCSDLPEAWFNLSHVYCTRDYTRLAEFRPKPGWIVVDAGAYLGFYTVYAARLVGRSGLVVAVEPLKRNRLYLEENVVLNGFADRVRVDPRALNDTRGFEYMSVSCYPATSSLVEEHVKSLGGDICGYERVATVSLPELLGEHGLNHVDLLKLDIEGLELKVLRVRGWERRVKRLVIEVHTDVVDVEDVRKLLEERGYTTRVVEIGSDTQVMVYAWL